MHGDNLGMVTVVSIGYSQMPVMMYLLQCLFLSQAVVISPCGQYITKGLPINTRFPPCLMVLAQTASGLDFSNLDPVVHQQIFTSIALSIQGFPQDLEIL